ncbi:hypothetical protein KTN05_09985 [Paracoccus sp. Z118]|uniref:hypothetical protein n=1 Tax=Paracoccus sp. Z118 TaxID=2851017 RepID=UPI001C2C5F21|nr:hypothetical protein [Paracoccus sp. Z118]MBV0892181.1 hypothetical protein [Paracoccus sp. Z118]
MRRVKAGELSDEVSFSTSPWFTDMYEEALSVFYNIKPLAPNVEDGLDLRMANSLEVGWRIGSTICNKMTVELGRDFVSGQTFIPAGRAFFTSIGRLVAGIEQGSALDPVTHRFARLCAGWRDRSQLIYDRLGESFHAERDRAMKDLFGGSISSKRDSEVIEMEDGRQVPFAFLSSGQQEIIPI